MAKAKSYIPEGLRTVTAHLVVPNALDAIEFYKKAFGAEVTSHHPGPAPRSTMHATIRIGDTALMLADEMPQSTAKSPVNCQSTFPFCRSASLLLTSVMRHRGAGSMLSLTITDSSTPII